MFRPCDIQLDEYVQGFRKEMQLQQRQPCSSSATAPADMPVPEDSSAPEDMALD